MSLLHKAQVVEVLREVDAWTLGASDYSPPTGQALRIKGGRALYERAWTDGRDAVRLERLDSLPEGLRPVIRWIHPEIVLQVVRIEVPRAPG